MVSENLMPLISILTLFIPVHTEQNILLLLKLYISSSTVYTKNDNERFWGAQEEVPIMCSYN